MPSLPVARTLAISQLSVSGGSSRSEPACGRQQVDRTSPIHGDRLARADVRKRRPVAAGREDVCEQDEVVLVLVAVRQRQAVEVPERHPQILRTGHRDTAPCSRTRTPLAIPGLTVRQNAVQPATQFLQKPQEMLNGTTTRPPFLRLTTAAPSSSTMPRCSCPNTMPALPSR
jgi:hypothetical protein